VTTITAISDMKSETNLNIFCKKDKGKNKKNQNALIRSVKKNMVKINPPEDD